MLSQRQGCNGGSRQVETFEKLNRIGEGTYGTVYRAIDKRCNEIVALKKVILHNEKQDGVRARVARADAHV